MYIFDFTVEVSLHSCCTSFFNPRLEGPKNLAHRSNNSITIATFLLAREASIFPPVPEMKYRDMMKESILPDLQPFFLSENGFPIFESFPRGNSTNNNSSNNNRSRREAATRRLRAGSSPATKRQEYTNRPPGISSR